MTELYTIPDAPKPPKQRFVQVVDPIEIESIQRAGLRDVIGCKMPGTHVWMAEVSSLRQFRGEPVEIVV